MEVYMGWSGVDCSVCQPLKRVLSRCQDFPWPPPSRKRETTLKTWCDVNICTPPCRFITKPQSEPQIVAAKASHQHLLSPSPRSSTFLRNFSTMRWMHFITFCVIDVDDESSLVCNSQHVLAFKWSRSTLEKKSFALLDFSSNRGEEWIGEETEIKSFIASPSSRHFASSRSGIVTERVRWRKGTGIDGYFKLLTRKI